MTEHSLLLKKGLSGWKNQAGQVKGKDYRITILVVEDLPQIFIEQDGKIVLNETVKSVDDLKIFLEERLYKYLEV